MSRTATKKKKRKIEPLEVMRKTGVAIILPRQRRRKGRRAKKSPYFPRYVLKASELQALGRVAVESGQLEWFLKMAVPMIAGVHGDLAPIVIRSRGVADWLDMLEKLGSETLENQYAAVCQRLVNELRQAIQKRNTAVHGAWIGEPATEAEYGKPWIPKRARAYNRKMELSASELLSVARRLEQLQYELWEFVIAAWPDRVVYVPEPRLRRLAAQ